MFQSFLRFLSFLSFFLGEALLLTEAGEDLIDLSMGASGVSGSLCKVSRWHDTGFIL